MTMMMTIWIPKRRRENGLLRMELSEEWVNCLFVSSEEGRDEFYLKDYQDYMGSQLPVENKDEKLLVEWLKLFEQLFGM